MAESEGGKGREEYKGSRTWQEAMENKQEVYTAQEIFDLMQTIELPKLDAENIRAGLLERGAKEEDIEFALQLAACIGAVNLLVFGERDVPLEFKPVKNKKDRDVFTVYCPMTESQRESFVVYVEDLHKDTLERLKEKFYSLRQAGDEGRPGKTKEELFLGYAVHEVRHRIQRKGGSKMFSIDGISSERDDLTKKVLIYTRNLFEEEGKIFRREGRSAEVIERRINPAEFDASVVEFMAHNRIHNGITLGDFIDLTMIQPVE